MPFPPDPGAIPAEELRRSYLRLTKLYELGHELFSQAALPGLFERIVAAACELLGAERVLLATVDGNTLVPRAAHELSWSADGPLPISSTMVAQVLESGEPLLTIDAAMDSSFGAAASVVANGIRSVICCVLGDPASPLGILYCDNNVRVRAFDEGDLPFLQALACYACIAIQHLLRIEAEREVAKAREETLERAYGAGHHLVGRSSELKRIYELVKRFAPTQVSVLVTGESGTGKEVIARAIHQESERRAGPFVPVHMGTLSRETAISQLFGHEKGAFTDATSPHHGFFVQAKGGVLFLDEITTATPEIQVLLLRALEADVVRPLGARSDVPVDVRIIAACNVDIEREVREGRFREDLYYRICVARIDVPPLRARRDDIDPLLHHFQARLAPGKSFEPAALDALRQHRWSGNVRELRNVVEIAGILACGDVIRLGDLPAAIAGSAVAAPCSSDGAPESLRQLMERVEREHIRRVLEHTGGHKERAIAILGIARATFFHKLKFYGLVDGAPAPRV
ncbi:MAG: sigma-54-dependent Fis family transcriptional regulator [bacterium]